MPAPTYGGFVNYQIQPGSSLGIGQDNLVVYTIPYAFATTLTAGFRAQFAKGVDCPVVGYSHLKLEVSPTITDSEGGKSTATLRFVGPDISGEFGEPDPTTVEYRFERQTLELFSSTIAADDGPWKGEYSFDKQIAIVNYIATSKQATAGNPPSDLSDPVLLRMEKDNPAGEVLDGTAPAVKDIPNDDTLYQIKAFKNILYQMDSGTGTWEIEELHERTLVRKEEV